MSRTGLDAQAIAKGMRDFARLVSHACEQHPWQTNVLLDAADMLDENARLRESVSNLLTQRDERLATAETESAKLRELFIDFWKWADPPFALRSGTFDELLAIVDRMRELGIEVQK